MKAYEYTIPGRRPINLYSELDRFTKATSAAPIAATAYEAWGKQLMTEFKPALETMNKWLQDKKDDVVRKL